MSADHVAIALPADPEVAQTVLHRGRRLARSLEIDRVAMLIQSELDVVVAHPGAGV